MSTAPADVDGLLLEMLGDELLALMLQPLLALMLQPPRVPSFEAETVRPPPPRGDS